MTTLFLLKCFFIGMLAASGCGPVFILTFNRGATRGFFYGLVTALGASIGDMLFFMLGLWGALAVIGGSRHFMFMLDFIGGGMLIIFGIRSLFQLWKASNVRVDYPDNLIVAFIRAFLLTMLNPLVVLFFMAISLQILPEGVTKLASMKILISSAFVFAGSLTILSGVSLIASYIGSCINPKRFKIISGLTGLVFLLFGGYLLWDFSLQILSRF